MEIADPNAVCAHCGWDPAKLTAEAATSRRMDRRVLVAFVLVVAAVALRVLGAFHGLAFDYASIACSALAAVCLFTVRRSNVSKPSL